MKRLLMLAVALWQIELAVQCGIATSQRPTAARPVAPPAPTPPDARQVIVRPQPSLPNCETGKCPPPQKPQSMPAR
jgi:hypothetical protein